VIVVIVVAYATYMSLGMPGMDHTSAVDPRFAGTAAAGVLAREDALATWRPDGSARPTGAAAAADLTDSVETALRSGEWRP